MIRQYFLKQFLRDEVSRPIKKIIFEMICYYFQLFNNFDGPALGDLLRCKQAMYYQLHYEQF